MKNVKKIPALLPNILYQIGSKILIGRHKLFPNGIIPIQELRHSLGHVFKSRLGRFTTKHRVVRVNVKVSN
jgi:hypothetical protein